LTTEQSWQLGWAFNVSCHHSSCIISYHLPTYHAVVLPDVTINQVTSVESSHNYSFTRSPCVSCVACVV